MEHLLGEAQHLEHAEHVGAELDAGADLLELRRLLQHLHRDALARQRQRGRKPADAAADDQNGGLLGARTHTVTPGHSDAARTLEHDAETWEAPRREECRYDKAACRAAGAWTAWRGRSGRRRRASQPDHHHRLAGAGRRRDRHHRPGAGAAAFSKAWGQQAVVENKPGANNQLAAEYIVNSPPDGHTLFIAPDGTFVANPSLYPKLPYDPYKSFTPISGLMIINHGLIEHPSFRAEQRQGADRARQEQARRDQLRHLRHRLERPSQHGAAGEHDRHQAAGGALQGRGAGDQRRGRRPHPDDASSAPAPRVPLWKAGKLKYHRGRRQASACRNCRTSRPWRRPCRATRRCRGSACSARPACRADVVAKINGEIRALFADPEFQKIVPRPLHVPVDRGLAGGVDELHQVKEEPKWRKIITDAKIKVE